jgi:DNA repair protein RecO (recombination protein O)
MATPGLLPLVLNSLYALGKDGASQQQIKAVFELRLACIAGYEPDLRGCLVCGNETPDRFDVSLGHLICSRCRDNDENGIRMPVSLGMLDTMRYICNCDPKRIFSFRLSEENLQAISYLTESYLSTQLERGFSALDFYKTLAVDQGRIHND